MDDDPFYVWEIPEDKLGVLFVNREADIEYTDRMIKSRKKLCIGVYGETGTGKSSMLNVILSLCKKEEQNVIKVNVDEYLSDQIDKPMEYDVLLIDNVNKTDDKSAIESYHKMINDVNTGTKIFFADKIRTNEETVSERNFTITHKPVILSKLEPRVLKTFLQVRMKRCNIKYNFTESAVELGSERSHGNLREFFRYCGMAHTYEIREITEKEMRKAIIEIDIDIISSLDELSIEILRILTEKTKLTPQILIMKIKESKGYGSISKKTIYSKLTTLKNYGILQIERNGQEVKYTTIYRNIGIDLIKEKVI